MIVEVHDHRREQQPLFAALIGQLRMMPSRQSKNAVKSLVGRLPSMSAASRYIPSYPHRAHTTPAARRSRRRTPVPAAARRRRGSLRPVPWCRDVRLPWRSAPSNSSHVPPQHAGILERIHQSRAPACSPLGLVRFAFGTMNRTRNAGPLTTNHNHLTTNHLTTNHQPAPAQPQECQRRSRSVMRSDRDNWGDPHQ